jgi:flagellar hook-associated protein 2
MADATISLGGLASGIDTGSLTTSLMAVANQPLDQLNARKAQVDSASATVSGLANRLSSLKAAALALSTNVGFASFSASSSDPGVVATASGSGSIGSYAVSVEALASSQKARSTTFLSSTTALGQSGSLALQVGSGTASSVQVLPTDTLADLATKITASGSRVSASVMNDGTGFRLIVQGVDSGAANSFTLGETGTALGFGAPDATYGTAADARFTVDGMHATSPSNQISGAIAGVKLALTKVTTSAATVQVTADSTALKTKVTALITAYNDFINNSHIATGFGGNKPANKVLSADSAVRSALHKIGNLMSNVVPGTSGKYTTMGVIGLKLGQDGTITLDSTKFDAAMTADPDSVRRLFVTDATTGATGLMKTLMTGVDGLVTGNGATIQSRIDALNAQSKRLADSATRMQVHLDDYQAQLKKSFTNMDQLVAKYKTMQASLGSLVTTSSTG